MTGFGSFVRSAPLVLFGSAAARTRDLQRVDAVVRTPLPLSRRIGFVQLRGGSGASSTAGYVANLLAARREGPVLGVDASSGSAGLLWHAGIPVSAGQRESGRRANARRTADAVDGLPRGASGLWTMSLSGMRNAPVSVDRWFESCTPITRFFDVVVTDWGVRDAQIDLADVAAASHVLCIVARADRHSAEQTAAVVAAVRSLDRAPTPVIALVDVGGTAGAAAGIVATSTDAPVVSIPYDQARASERQIGSSALATRTRLAYARLAEELMIHAIGSGETRGASVEVRSIQEPARAAAVRTRRRSRRSDSLIADRDIR